MSAISGKTCCKRVGIILSIIFLGAIAFLYSGIYPMGADSPHFRVTYWVLETLREQSISRAANDVVVPKDLNDSNRLLAGGADYNDMCSGCHLKPAKESSDLSLGLYPSPPNLALNHEEYTNSEKDSDKRRFWIIKHGIKASGMPAWAPGHSDERIWSMVAFIKRLPDLTAEQYQILTARTVTSDRHH
jgi:mono/diheme cytochrome c family protein